MKNKKAIIILSMILLILMMTAVSANDCNTTEISAGDTEDVACIDNENSNNDDDLVDETADLHEDNELLSVSDDDSSTVQYNSNTFTKL